MNSSRNSQLSWGSPPRSASPLSIPPAPSPLRQSIRPSQVSKPGELQSLAADEASHTTNSLTDTEKEELRVQVNTLRYELENIKQERDLMVLRHEKELRDVQLKADADFRKAQVCTFYGTEQSEN